MRKTVDRDKWLLALRQLADALKLLDESNAPLEIGAAIDLAIHRLQAVVESTDSDRLGSATPRRASSNNQL